MPSERYADINETVKEEWREESDSFERVKDVLLTTDYPTTPGNISDQALVNETAAKKYLEHFDNLGLARSYESKTGRVYTKNQEYYDAQRLSELTAKYTEEKLEKKKSDMGEEIDSLEDKYETTSPDRVENVERENHEPGEETFEEMNRWKMLLENYHLVRALIEYKKAQSI